MAPFANLSRVHLAVGAIATDCCNSIAVMYWSVSVNILVEECNAFLARCAIYTCDNGTKLCALIAKLEITVWHCPGKIYLSGQI